MRANGAIQRNGPEGVQCSEKRPKPAQKALRAHFWRRLRVLFSLRLHRPFSRWRIACPKPNELRLPTFLIRIASFQDSCLTSDSPAASQSSDVSSIAEACRGVYDRNASGAL